MGDFCDGDNVSSGKRRHQGYRNIDATTLQCLSSDGSPKDVFPLFRLFKYDVWLIRRMFILRLIVRLSMHLVSIDVLK